MYIFVTVLFVLFWWCFNFYWTRRRLYRMSWNVPGPLNLPIIGYAYSTLQGGISETAKKMLKLVDSYPKLFKFWLGPHLIYVSQRAEDAKIILNASGALDKFILMEYLAALIGNGLITQPADIWRRHRKIVAPALKQNILNTNPKAISEECLVLLRNLEKFVGKGETDPCRIVTNCAFDIMGKTMFGFSVNAQENDETYSETLEKGLEIVFLRMSRLFYQFDWIFTRSNDYKALMAVTNKIRRLAEQIFENSKHNDDKLLIRLMRAELQTKQITEKEIEDEVYTFLIAGTDTNSLSTCTLLTILAVHQDVQQKVYEEVVEVIGSEPTIDLETFNKLEYTKRAVKESLRLLPSVPFIGRLLVEDLVVDGTVVPKGANIGLSIVHIHRSEKYWKDPLKFDPDRFLPENSTDRHPYAWIPFSAGPRNCIGFKHALMSIRIMTAMIIRKFKVTTSIKSIHDIDFNVNIVSKPVDGFRLSFELR